jgi:hypothetical protein
LADVLSRLWRGSDAAARPVDRDVAGPLAWEMLCRKMLAAGGRIEGIMMP